MDHARRRPDAPPACEALEGRALLSGFGLPRAAQAAIIDRIGPQLAGVTTDPAGIAAVQSALRGGPGSEFVALLQRQVPDLGGLIRQFISGARTSATTAGVAVSVPQFQGQFAGTHYDFLAETVAGALLQPNRSLELGAILRGPDRLPVTSYVVFGIDRGGGAALGPAFAGRPGITPDALVTVAVAPFGSGTSGTITDLESGTVTAIDPSRIQVVGATVRVTVDTAQLPSEGLPASRYLFASWTRISLQGGIETVGSFLPDTSMIPVGLSRR